MTTQDGRQTRTPRQVAAEGHEPGPWVAIPEPAPVRVRAMLANALLARAERRLEFAIVRNDRPGSAVRDSDVPVLRLHRPDAFSRRLGADGMTGFGEAYQTGDWDSDDLAGLMTVLLRGIDEIVPPALQGLRGHRAAPRRPSGDHQTVDGALSNARHHYALPDGLFRAFLDETMSYSSAMFRTDDDGRPVADDAALAEAQRRKIDRLLDLAAVGQGTRLLEIGTGWGELPVRAAQRGAVVRTVTNMAEHAVMARDRIADAGLTDRIQVELADYRTTAAEPASFDAIISVEMIEAVGRDYWPLYFEKLEGFLAPGGRIGLQMMVMPHVQMLRTSKTYTWIDKYIFPGGLLPSITAIEETVAGHTQLRIADRLAFGAHYAATLALWRERFNRNWEAVADLGFDETFRRTWEFYLAYCEAGFASGYLNVYQFLLQKG
jgi:cyclopropane-fatty-acyl-phospholipid synthase